MKEPSFNTVTTPIILLSCIILRMTTFIYLEKTPVLKKPYIQTTDIGAQWL